MDMYQKRKIRQEKKKQVNSNDNQNSLSKTSINWDIRTLGKTFPNPYK